MLLSSTYHNIARRRGVGSGVSIRPDHVALDIATCMKVDRYHVTEVAAEQTGSNLSNAPGATITKAVDEKVYVFFEYASWMLSVSRDS